MDLKTLVILSDAIKAQAFEESRQSLSPSASVREGGASSSLSPFSSSSTHLPTKKTLLRTFSRRAKQFSSKRLTATRICACLIFSLLVENLLPILEFGKSTDTVFLLCRNPLEKDAWEAAINQQIVALRKYEYIFSLKDLGAFWPPLGVTTKLLSSCLFGNVCIVPFW